MSYVARVAALELLRVLRHPVYGVFVTATVLFETWEVVQLAHAPYGPIRHDAPTNVHLRTTFLMLYAVVVVVLPWLAARVARERVSGERAWVAQCVRSPRGLRLGRWIALSLAASAVAAVGLAVLRLLPPWLDPDPHAFGGFVPGSVLRAWVLFALLPSIAFGGLILGLAERVATPASLYGLAVLFIGLWFLTKNLVPLVEAGSWLHTAYALVEPFGTVAEAQSVHGWTPDELNARLGPLTPLLVANRVVWLALGALVWWWVPTREAPPEPRATRSLATRWPALQRQLTSPVWRAGAAVVVVAAGSTVRSVRRFDHTYPTTDVLVHDVEGLLRLVTLGWFVIASIRIFCLHETRRTASWVRSAKAPPTRSAANELAAMAVSGAGLSLVAMVALGVFQTVASVGSPFSMDTPWLYPVELFGFQFPQTLQRGAFVAAAAVATRRAWVVVLAAVIPGLLDQAALLAGVDSALLRPGMNLDLDYSFMAGFDRQLPGHLSYVVHWGLFAALLLLAGLRRWSRWALHPPPPARKWMLGLSAAFALSHGWILYNTASLNDFDPPTLGEMKAAYERAWGHVEGLPQPVLVGGDYAVELHPSSGRTEVEGILRGLNPHATSIAEVHMTWHRDLQVRRLAIGEAEVERFPETHHAVVRPAEPLAPGARFEIAWSATTAVRRGFRNQDRRAPETYASEVQTLPNGTNVLNLHLLPTFGYLRRFEHAAAWARSRYHLPEEGALTPTAAAAASTAHGASHLGRGDWTLVLGTEAPQRPVAGGVEEARWEEGRRAYVRTRSANALGWTRLASGIYATERADVAGHPIELFWHPSHDWNVGRLRERLEAAAMWHAEALGSERGRPLRVVEASFHQGGWGVLGGAGFASEIHAWKMDRTIGSSSLDEFARYLVARTWVREWVVPADVAGAKTLHMGLPATFSEWCATEGDEDRMAPPDAAVARRERLVEQWFESRAGAMEPEASMLEVFRDSSGPRTLFPLRMMQLREAVGPARFRAALVAFVARHAAEGPPYATAADLKRHLARELGDAVPWIDRAFAVYGTEDVRLLRAESRGEAIHVEVDVRSGAIVPLRWAVLDGEGKALASRVDHVPPGRHRLAMPQPGEAAEVVLDPEVGLADPSRRDNRAPLRSGGRSR
ncbi:MAG: hypothetical protein AAGH15_00760 [Myxococcota bacterium]